MAERRIVAIGGLGEAEDRARLAEYVLGFTGRSRPRVCFVPTASADDAESIVCFYEAWGGRCEATHLRFFPWPPDRLRELVLAQDVVLVGGGNTANMLAIWRVHGFDRILREAWEAGGVLSGVSAGMICWFEAGVTDSFGPQLEGMRDGLGLLPGSACPHYDGEELRRPRYRALVAEGFPSGYAADDGVALRFAGGDLAEVVTLREGARAYLVERRNAGVAETPLEARLVS